MAANDRALDLLRKSDGLADEDGLLHAASPGDDAALQRMLARALPAFARPGHGRLDDGVASWAPRRGWRCMSAPLAKDGRTCAPSVPRWVVLIVDLADRARVDPDLVASILGLTPAESLTWRCSWPREAPSATSPSPQGGDQATIRWHTKQIFGKLNISRQVELVQLVQSLADLPTVRR